MTPERWSKIKSLFQEAIGLPPPQREVFLQQHCDGDEALRGEVEAMLRDSDSAKSFIETPAFKQFAPELAAEQTSLIGQRLAHYQVEAELGAGGMGRVYQARDEKLKRHVAIKILPAEFVADADRVRRFEQEAYAASSLNHPYIITVYEIGEENGLHYIAYELVEGQTLRQRLAQSHLSWLEAVSIAAQIAEALKAAHGAGIIHRDIKPENVMLRADGRVKVLDFGIAKRFDVSAANEEGDGKHVASRVAGDSTLTGGLFGTLRYLSPEQVRGQKIDARADIFALGLMLYEMLTGHPFAGKSDEQILAELLDDRELPGIGELRGKIPAALKALVAKAVSKGRAQRYDSVGQMLETLNELKPAPESQTTEKLRGAQALFRAQNANRMLNQFVSLFAVDNRTRLSPTALWTIWRYSDIKRGKLEAALLRKSLVSALSKGGLIALLAGLLTFVVAAWFSIEEKWDERHLHDGHTAAVRRAIFSPDGQWLVSVSEDKQVFVWDIERRLKHKALGGHSDLVTAAAFSPDGRWFATGSHDKTVIVWDTKSFEKVVTLREHRDQVRAIAFSPDGQSLVSVSSIEAHNEGQTIVWRTGEWQKVWEFAAGNVYGNLLFSPDSRLLMTPSGQWDLSTGQKLSQDEDWGGMGNWAEFSPDRKLLVTIGLDASFSSLARPGNIATRKLIHRERQHQDFGRAVAFSPDGKLVATGSDDIVVWETATRKLWARWDFEAVVWSLAFSPDGKSLVSTHGDGSILLWGVAQMDRSVSLNGHIKGVRAVAISPDQKRVASASEDKSVIVWDAEHGGKEMVLKGHETRVTGVVFSPDGKWLASADQDGFLIRWDLKQQQPRWKIKALNNSIVSLANSPDGRWLAVTHGVYDSNDGREILNFPKLNLKVGSEGVAFSADGRKVVWVGVFGIFVFKTDNWQITAQRNTDNLSLISVAFSPDGRKLVTGDLEGKVILWDAETLQPLTALGQHGARIKAIAFSPDGQSIVSAGDDKQIALWDMSWRRSFLGGLLARDVRIGTHTAPVLAIAFSPDGNSLVSGEHDKSVRLYTRYRALWGWRLD